MKYIILLFFIIAATAIICGLTLNLDYAPKLVGGGIVGLFL